MQKRRRSKERKRRGRGQASKRVCFCSFALALAFVGLVDCLDGCLDGWMAGCPLSEVCVRLEVDNSKQMVDVLLMLEMRTFGSLDVQSIHCEEASGVIWQLLVSTQFCVSTQINSFLLCFLASLLPSLLPSFLALILPPPLYLSPVHQP